MELPTKDQYYFDITFFTNISNLHVYLLIVDQRVCMVPDGDFFQAIRDGKSSISTGQIDHFTENGIQMKNGKHVDADLVILATGMNIQSNFPFSTIKVVYYTLSN